MPNLFKVESKSSNVEDWKSLFMFSYYILLKIHQRQHVCVWQGKGKGEMKEG